MFNRENRLCVETGGLGRKELLLLDGEGLLLLGSQVEKGLVLAVLEVTVVSTDDAVGIIDGNGTDVSHGLDLGSALLVLSISHLKLELLSTGLDGVPASQTRSEVNVTGHAEVGGVDDLVSAGVVEDSLGVDTSLVGEGTETGDVVVEGDVDLNGLGDEVLDLLELLEAVLALDVLGGGDHHTGHQTTERGDTVALTDSENGGIDVSGTSLEGTVCVGNGTAGIVVEVSLDVTADNTAQDTDELVDLAGRGTANGVGNTNTVNADLVDGGVDGQKVDQVGTEGVLTGETDLNALGLDELDNFNGGVLDIGHILAVGVLTEVRGGTNDNIARYSQFEFKFDFGQSTDNSHSINTGLDGNAGIVHVATDVSEDLRIELDTNSPNFVLVTR